MPTEGDDSTKTSPLRSSAEAAISSLRSLQSSVKSLASKATSDTDRERVLQLARKAAPLADWLKIESLFLTAGPKHLAMAEAFHSQPRKYSKFALIGGNRAGKSVCGGRMCFAKHLRDHAKAGAIYWCVAPTTEKSIAGQQRELWESLPRSLLGDASYNEQTGYGGQRPSLVIDPLGRRIVIRFKTAAQYDSDPASFEQEKVSGVWVDETVPEGVYKRIVPRLIDLNGFLLVTTIPDDEWIDEAFGEEDCDDIQRGVFVRRLTMYDNRMNLSEEGIRNAIESMSEDERTMRVYGKSIHKTGLVYKEFVKDYKPDGHLIRPFKIPREWPRYRAMDVGRDHPTVCLWAAVAPNDSVYVYREYVARNTTVQEDADKILTMSKGELFTSPCIIDPAAYAVTKSNPKSVGYQFAEAGLKCMPGVRSNKHPSGGEFALVQNVKRWLETYKLFVFDSCPYLISEFRKWKYARDRDNNPVGRGRFVDANNDALDALKYLLALNPSFEAKTIEIESVKW